MLSDLTWTEFEEFFIMPNTVYQKENVKINAIL